MADRYVLRLPAIEVKQGSRQIYCFAVDGKCLHEFTTVSRVHRDEDSSLKGYQRPEVLSHIKAIRRYLESDGALLPNAIVLAFNSSVRFEPYRRKATVGYSTPGELVIPVDESLPESEKPALLVDGQQRSAAIRDADLAEFPVAAVAFIAQDQEEQRSQFILVNNTKPLPKGLIHELLPETRGFLPAKYARRQLPAYLMARLNSDGDSPFVGRIATPTSPDGYIRDTSVLKMIENSLFDGALYQYRNPLDGNGDTEQMLLHLKAYWNRVYARWTDAWRLQPRLSRLTHGVGIQALGYVMDAMTEGYNYRELGSLGIAGKLDDMSEGCAWTSGTWRFSADDVRRWNSLQNTPNDIRALTNYLLHQLKEST